jgi:CRP-like cAMP-binding protein
MNKNHRRKQVKSNMPAVASGITPPEITDKTCNNQSVITGNLPLLDEFTIDGFFKNKLLAGRSKELNDLLPFFELVSLSENESIYRRNDAVDYIYFPETAVVSEFQVSAKGGTMEIAMTGKEGALGLLPFCWANRAANWTCVLLAGTAYRIKTSILANAVFQPCLQSLLQDHIGNYLRQISQRSICNCFHSVDERLCGWLLMLQARQEYSNELALTQERIADLLGMQRPTLTFAARRLRAEGIIDYAPGRIIIRDRGRLKELACDCYSAIDRDITN